MSYRLRCDRLMVFAERRPYDGAWTLAGGREYATPFRTREDALAALPAVLEACGDTWRVSSDDFRVMTDPIEDAEALKRANNEAIVTRYLRGPWLQSGAA